MKKTSNGLPFLFFAVLLHGAPEAKSGDGGPGELLPNDTPPKLESRMAAVQHPNASQTFLAEVALNEEEEDETRKAAIRRLESQTVLVEMLKNEKLRYEIHLEVFKRMDQLNGWEDKQVFLAKIAMQNTRIASSAAMQVKDEKLLEDIAKNASYEAARQAALRNLINPYHNQAFLLDIIYNDPHEDVRCDALVKIFNQAVIAEVAKKSRHLDVRKMAIRRLANKATAAAIGLKDESEEVRCLVLGLGCVTDPILLAEIAKNDEFAKVRRLAIETGHITDQTVLADIVKNEVNEEVRVSVVKSKLITDPTLLAEIAKNDTNVNMRDWAVRQLTDEALLAEILQNDTSLLVRVEAAAKLDDQTFLEACVQEGNNHFVRWRAVYKLRNEVLLEELATHDTSETVLQSARRRLEVLRKDKNQGKNEP